MIAKPDHDYLDLSLVVCIWHHILPLLVGRWVTLRFLLQSRRLVKQLLDVLIHRSALQVRVKVFTQHIAKVLRIVNVIVASDTPGVLVLVYCLLKEVVVADAHILKLSQICE